VVSNPRLLWFQRTHLNVGHARILLVLAAIVLVGCGGASMSVPSRQLIAISVQPLNGDAVAPSGTIPFSASGTFNQMPTTEDPLTVDWSSSDSTVVAIDASTGLATCIAVGGPITITASSAGKKGSGMLTCLSSTPGTTGHCVYVCGSTRCGALSGYCSSSDGGACRQAYDPGNCPVGQPANSTATDSCGVGIDTTRSCSP
jgi:hypothetical protein